VKFGVMTLPTAPWDELVRRWRALDAMRFEAIWTPDHLVGVRAGGSWFEGWASLAGIAQATERARVGTLVSPVTFHNPARIAKAAVTLDHLSRGRLELGIGAGGSPADHELAQVERWPPGERARRLRAFVERLDELSRDERLRPPPLQDAIPLTIGGTGAAALELAARFAVRWSSSGGVRGTQPDEAAAAAREQSQALDALCAERGRDPADLIRSILVGHPYTGETPWRSESAFRETVERWREAGMTELVVYYPPESGMPPGSVEPGLFERIFAQG
jgi:alkanesulfonate monooxygenase SsuD/methylene tetrahydromethanopterin reductase-like flavin-dependent oxidoreductase (luciferase family)